ncbi:alpha/beta-hydrolase family protein [Mycolicibacterium sp.]|uniref:alpha/beta hydrolase n=1 Tax=Mycolicibacterium sp. TaxID=2320850 RepID=UPI0028A6CB4A|nr:alpha/beta-hydrolase family protein [Mycolicibacterium sp.]
MTVTEAAPAPSPTAEPKQDWWQRRYTFTGTAVGFLFMLLSMTPSLLPRGPLFQGIVSGAAGAIGYLLGVFAVWLVRFMRSRPSSPPAPRWAWPVLVAVGALALVLGIVYFHYWQDHVRDLFGVPRLKWYDYITAGALSLVVLFLFVEIGQLIGRLVRFLARQLSRVAPPRVSFVVTLIAVLAVFVAVLNGVVVRGTMSLLNKTFSGVNDELDPNHPAPTSALRSGGPGSEVPWSSMGHQGRIFVGNGPTVAQLTEFNKAPATEPIRAYAGLNSANGIRATAELAAAELERKGGLKRKLIAVATTTGTGWINAAEADSLEYMYNGDTAIVSMQYSYLPSWLSFLVDKENARQAGQALFEAVDEKVRALPEAQRPKIVVFGESLGSFGGEAPFLSPNNIIARTDGALFSGPTFRNTMRDFVTDNRDAGSPEWLPIFDNGANVRFAARAENLGRPEGPWGNPRVAYLQHASDPIAWWTPDLLFAQPDWLREPRGYDVSGDMNWIPVVTFLQVAADMAVAVDVPDGHGHRYVKDVVNAWAAVLRPAGWTPEKTEKLRGMVTQDYAQ